MKSILGDAELDHVCLVTDKIDESRKIFAQWLGTEIPEAVSLPVRNITYRGKPAPRLGCRQMGFEVSGFTVELIEPNTEDSAWNDYLSENGPGLHHLCFKVGDLGKVTEGFVREGVPVVQTGEFEGGRYAYVDARRQIGMYLELLELN